jgi:CO/xanthine dehydrogenase Mo-binding subunit
MKDPEKGLYHLRGIPVPETPKPGENPGPWEKTEVVGKPLPRVDAYDRVSGTAEYPSDVVLPNMLYAAVLRSPHPHARVTAIVTTRAERMPGVKGVISGASPAADLWWPYAKDSKTRLFDPTCRFEGEEVAAVAAETPDRARDALRAIEVRYEVLPFVVEETKALAGAAPAVHPGGNRVKTDKYSRGDVAKGFAEADLVLEETYSSACEVHTPLELHGCVARWDGDRLTIWQSTQGVYSVQASVAEVMGLPLAKVRVIGHYLGGDSAASSAGRSSRSSPRSWRNRPAGRSSSSSPAKRPSSPWGTGPRPSCGSRRG